MTEANQDASAITQISGRAVIDPVSAAASHACTSAYSRAHSRRVPCRSRRDVARANIGIYQSKLTQQEERVIRGCDSGHPVPSLSSVITATLCYPNMRCYLGFRGPFEMLISRTSSREG